MPDWSSILTNIPSGGNYKGVDISDSSGWLQNLLKDPKVIAALMAGGFGTIGDLLQSSASAKQLAAQLGANAATTEAGFYGDTRAEDLSRSNTAASMMQQSPFTQFDARSKEAMKTALARGEDVGYDFDTTTNIPGVGAVPQLGFNMGSYAKDLQTPENLAAEDAKWQMLQKQISPSSPVSDLGQIYGSNVGSSLMDRINSAGQLAQTNINTSRNSQLEAIRRMLAKGGGTTSTGSKVAKKGLSAGAGALTGAQIGAMFGGVGAPIGAGLGALAGLFL